MKNMASDTTIVRVKVLHEKQSIEWVLHLRKLSATFPHLIFEVRSDVRQRINLFGLIPVLSIEVTDKTASVREKNINYYGIVLVA